MMWNPHRQRKKKKLSSTPKHLGRDGRSPGRRWTPGSRSSLPPLRAFAVPQESFIYPLFKLQCEAGFYLSQPVKRSWALAMTPARLLDGRLFHLRNYRQQCKNTIKIPRIGISSSSSLSKEPGQQEGFLKQVKSREGRRHKPSLKEKRGKLAMFGGVFLNTLFVFFPIPPPPPPFCFLERRDAKGLRLLWLLSNDIAATSRDKT